MQAPRKARSSSRRSTGSSESRRRYSCMATRTVRSGIGAGGVGLRRGLGSFSHRSARLYDTSAFTNAFGVKFDLRRTRKSSGRAPGFEDAGLRAFAAPLRPRHESHLHHKSDCGFPISARRVDSDIHFSGCFLHYAGYQRPDRRPGARPARRIGPEPRGARRPLQRQPLDDLAGGARRDQPHRGGPRKDRHRRSACTLASLFDDGDAPRQSRSRAPPIAPPGRIRSRDTCAGTSRHRTSPRPFASSKWHFRPARGCPTNPARATRRWRSRSGCAKARSKSPSAR